MSITIMPIIDIPSIHILIVIKILLINNNFSN